MKAFNKLWIVLLLSALPLSAAPVVNPGGIVNVASYSTTVAPGSIAAIFGAGLSNGTACNSQNCGPSFDSNGQIIPTMAGATVTFNTFAAPILSTPNATQLNVQVPVELAGATSATVVVTVAGQSSAPVTVSLAPLAPGLISLNASGNGQGAILNDRDANAGVQSPVTPPCCRPNAHPALPGDVIEIYGTGLGAMTPLVATGMRPTGLPQTVTKPIVTIGGIPAVVNFAGLASCCVGLNQVNVTVPAGVATSTAVPLVLTIGGVVSNMVTIAVGSFGGNAPVFLAGTANSLTGTIPGWNSFGLDSTAIGSVSISGTGASSGNQTVYTASGSGGGTVSCKNLTGSNTTSNWTVFLTSTATVNPAVTSLGPSGGSVSGTWTISFTVTACGSTQTQTLTGPVTGTVSPGGAVTMNLNPGGGGGGGGGGSNPVVLTGTATSVSTTLPGTVFFDNTATGSVPLSLTGVSSGSQTVYSGSANGSGTVSCQQINGSNTTSNWTASVSATVTVSPAITSLVTSGGSVSGTWSASVTITACGQSQTESPTGTLTVTGSVSQGGAVTLTLSGG